MFKKILFIVLGCFVFVVVMLCAFVRLRHIRVALICQDYTNICFENSTNNVSINIYVSDKKTYFTDISKIDEAIIENDSDQVETIIKSIDYLGEEKIKNKTYYLYSYNLALKVKLSADLFIDNAKLKLSFTNGKEATLDVGDVSFYLREEIKEQSSLSIMMLKGIVNEIDSKKRVCGVAIKAKSSKDIKITNVEILDPFLVVNGIRNVKYDDLEQDTKITNYSYKSMLSPNCDIDINGDYEFLITIGNSSNYDIMSFGLLIYYLDGDETIKFKTDKYCFYQSNFLFIDLSDITIYEYEYY